MAGETPQDRDPNFDPIKEVFIDAGIAEVIEHRENPQPEADPIDDMVVTGELSVADAASLKVMRDAIEEQKAEAHEEASRLIAEHIIGARRTGKETPVSRFFEAVVAQAEETDDFRPMPITYFRDEDINPTGLTPEEWSALPESTREVLRDRKYSDDA